MSLAVQRTPVDRDPAHEKYLVHNRLDVLSILRALAGLEESTPNKAMIAMLRDLRQGLESGRELSVAMRKHDKVFSKFYVSMIQVGELTGRMEDVLLQLYHHLEFEKFMREQVKSAIRYPSFVIATMAVAIVIINLFVIPAFAKVFKGFNAELPLMTQILINFSNFTVAWWPALLVVASSVMARMSITRPEEALEVHSEEMCRSCPVQPQCKYSLVK